MSKRQDDDRVDIDLDIVNQVMEEERGQKRKLSAKERELRKKKKRRKKRLKIAMVVVEFLVLVVAVLFLVFKFVPGGKEFLLSNCAGPIAKCFISEDTYKSIFDKNFNKDDIKANEGLNLKSFDGYITLALFGVDSRDEGMDDSTHTDSIMIASINEKTGQVKISSVFRDSWLAQENKDGKTIYDKINSAYFRGGAEGAINALNYNLDLHITDYVTVNFAGLATVIDQLGGLDITLTDDEAYWINQYLTETRKITGMDSPDIKEEAGTYHLDGLQCTAYCRNRYSKFYYEDGSFVTDDMGRTARQRHVIMLMVQKAKEAGVSKVMDIAQTVFSGDKEIIKTSIPYDDMMDMIPTLINFQLGETKGFPFTFAYPDKAYTDGASAVAVAGLEYNVKKLHQFLFDDNDYKPSSTVSKLSDKLEDILHVYEKKLPEDEENDSGDGQGSDDSLEQ